MIDNNKTWEELYIQALLESDSQRLPQRIVVTREAIAGRLQVLKYGDNQLEMHRIEDALFALTRMRVPPKEL
jgi:hypothetical protein